MTRFREMFEAIRDYKKPIPFEGQAKLEKRTSDAMGFGGPTYPVDVESYALVVTYQDRVFEIPFLKIDHKEHVTRERVANIDRLVELCSQGVDLNVTGTFRRPATIWRTYGPNEHYRGHIRTNGMRFYFDINIQQSTDEHVLSEIKDHLE